jgi:hypothetical protein
MTYQVSIEVLRIYMYSTYTVYISKFRSNDRQISVNLAVNPLLVKITLESTIEPHNCI